MRHTLSGFAMIGLCLLYFGIASSDTWCLANESSLPPTEHQITLHAGRLTLQCRAVENGVKDLTLADLTTGRVLVSGVAPLFTIKLRNATSGEEKTLSADTGWQHIAVEQAADQSGLTLTWRDPVDEALAGLTVCVRTALDATQAACRWDLRVENANTVWALWTVRFPQVTIPEPTEDAWVVYPKASGVAEQGVWQRNFRFSGRYPSGWTVMPLVAVYPGNQQGGLYLAIHDPWGSTKEIDLASRPNEKLLVFSVEHPVPDMGQPGKGFTLEGQAVWQIFDGDWFDAACIYRDWVRKEAKWYPSLGHDGREDTVRWMRELPLWALGGGAPAECVDRVKAFAAFFEVPVGFHWYNWHQIPFDNDYPHYFPFKDGFPEGVKDLQEHNVFVMPYINGRLWDTRDKGLEDFQFSAVAKAGVSKNERGEPYMETYNSKESDNSPVRLGVMCPATELWQNKVHEIVTRLFQECGVKAVYIDQIAAAAPTLCFDASHGHPLGGGHWWTEGYWKMLERIRADMPSDRMITTECNAEPYIRWLDGYLTWHWQYPNMVPLFPAVYGGSIQMFGRYYGNTGSGLLPSAEEGKNRDTALRMRAAQQLVFGEQLGWINFGVIQEPENASFLKALVQVRAKLVRYFYAGEMARPPRVIGSVPKIEADWQWHGKMVITDDALYRGCWLLPQEKRLVVMAVNAADEEIRVRLEIDAARWGLPEKELHVRLITPTEDVEQGPSPPQWHCDVVLPARSVRAWDLQAGE